MDLRKPIHNLDSPREKNTALESGMDLILFFDKYTLLSNKLYLYSLINNYRTNKIISFVYMLPDCQTLLTSPNPETLKGCFGVIPSDPVF